MSEEASSPPLWAGWALTLACLPGSTTLFLTWQSQPLGHIGLLGPLLAREGLLGSCPGHLREPLAAKAMRGGRAAFRLEGAPRPQLPSQQLGHCTKPAKAAS